MIVKDETMEDLMVDKQNPFIAWSEYAKIYKDPVIHRHLYFHTILHLFCLQKEYGYQFFPELTTRNVYLEVLDRERIYLYEFSDGTKIYFVARHAFPRLERSDSLFRVNLRLRNRHRKHRLHYHASDNLLSLSRSVYPILRDTDPIWVSLTESFLSRKECRSCRYDDLSDQECCRALMRTTGISIDSMVQASYHDVREEIVKTIERIGKEMDITFGDKTCPRKLAFIVSLIDDTTDNETLRRRIVVALNQKYKYVRIRHDWTDIMIRLIRLLRVYYCHYLKRVQHENGTEPAPEILYLIMGYLVLYPESEGWVDGHEYTRVTRCRTEIRPFSPDDLVRYHPIYRSEILS
jgi:hypothetical protein